MGGRHRRGGGPGRLRGRAAVAGRRAAADATLAGIDESLAKQVAKGKLDDAEREAVLARITPTAELDDLFDCDLVIESVVEDLAVKKPLFAELDAVCRPSAILATNTSTLSVIELAVQTRRPDGSAASTSSTRRRSWRWSRSCGR